MRDFSWKNTVTVRISRHNFEAFANGCRKEKIILSNIESDDKGYICTMDFASFRRIRSVASASGVRAKIIRKQGAGYFVRIHRKRYGFYLGALMAFTAFIYLTSCIWVVDVVGNDLTSTSEILEVMEENGIGIGKLRYGKKISRIKNNALIDLDSLAWLWVTLDGTRAVVEVREKGDYEEIIDKTEPCNLVASFAGEIVDMQVKSGRKIVERGNIVNKGDLLVSGITETAYRSNRYIHSMGSVSARTWRTLDGEYSHKEVLRIKTGEEEKKHSINVFGKEIRLYRNSKSTFSDYDKTVKNTSLKIFKNIYLPLTFTTETFCEIIKEYNTLEDDTVLERAVNFLTKELENQRAENAVTLKRTYGYEKLSNGNLYVTVTLESRENIATPVKIEVETTEEDLVGKDY